MDMLKVKDHVDLKELEKLGYKLGQDDGCHEAYIKELGYHDYIAIYDDRTILLDIEDFCGSSWEKFIENQLFDLIEADLIERI